MSLQEVQNCGNFITLLEDENYIELIAFYYPHNLEKYYDVTDKQLLWELIKMELRSKTISYSKPKRSKLRNKEEALQKELKELDHKFYNGEDDVFDQGTLDKYEAAKGELKRFTRHGDKGHVQIQV